MRWCLSVDSMFIPKGGYHNLACWDCLLHLDYSWRCCVLPRRWLKFWLWGFMNKHTSHLLCQGSLKVDFSRVVLTQKIKSISHFFHWCFSAKSLGTQLAHCFWNHNYSGTILKKSGFTHIWIFKWQSGNCESPTCTGLFVHDSNQNLVWWLIFGLMVCRGHFPSILESSHPLLLFAVR